MYKQLCYSLVEKGLVKRGSFTLKSGATSNFYIDLDALPSYPRLIAQVASGLIGLLPMDECVLVGVPYAAIPLATAMSMVSGIPQVVVRQEESKPKTKLYKDHAVVIVDDVVATGTSVLKQCSLLKEDGYRVAKVIAVVDRNGGGRQAIREAGFEYEYLFSVEDLYVSLPVRIRTVSRSETRPRSRVVLAYDAPIGKPFFDLVDLLGPLLAGIKFHSEILQPTEHDLASIHVIAKEYGLFLWEDRKFTDAADTVNHQMKLYETRGIDYVTVTTLGGSDVMNPTPLSRKKPLRKVVVAEMTSQGNLFGQPTVSAAVMKHLAESQEGYHGVFCKTTPMIRYADAMDKETFVAGISLSKDGASPQWRTPDQFDVLPTYFVIGRALRVNPDPKRALLAYSPFLLS
jgi:uridine monophosphate synthetase